MMIDHAQGEFRGRRYAIRPGRPGLEDQASPPGSIFYTIEYGEDLTFVVMGHRHETAVELQAQVQRLLERVGRGATGGAQPTGRS
jgi:hypothetical protein